LKIKRTSQSAKIARHEKAIGELYAIVQILAKKVESLENQWSVESTNPETKQND
jgi:hypothetical protein